MILQSENIYSDSAEYDQEEIATMLHKLNKNNLLQLLVVTRFDCVQSQYAKIQTLYNKPSQFMGAYAKATLHIKMSNYDNQAISQGFNYDDAIINEEMGKVIEYCKFLNNEKYKETWSRPGVNK